MLVPGHAQRAPTGILAIRTYRSNHMGNPRESLFRVENFC